MELSDVDLSFYNLEITRVAEELNTLDMVHNGKMIELRLRPTITGSNTKLNKLLTDASLMSLIRNSSDERVTEAFEQLKIVMALTGHELK